MRGGVSPTVRDRGKCSWPSVHSPAPPSPTACTERVKGVYTYTVFQTHTHIGIHRPGSWRSSARYPQRLPLAAEGPTEPQLLTLLSLKRERVKNVKNITYITALHSLSSIWHMKTWLNQPFMKSTAAAVNFVSCKSDVLFQSYKSCKSSKLAVLSFNELYWTCTVLFPKETIWWWCHNHQERNIYIILDLHSICLTFSTLSLSNPFSLFLLFPIISSISSWHYPVLSFPTMLTIQIDSS